MERVIRLITFKLKNIVIISFYEGLCYKKSPVFKLPVTEILPTSGMLVG